ncbi:RNA-directed DNA polymerase, eukaryota, reverse transcriptase zinc-binding domain protein, partial [Tanacetum coccineum]
LARLPCHGGTRTRAQVTHILTLVLIESLSKAQRSTTTHTTNRGNEEAAEIGAIKENGKPTMAANATICPAKVQGTNEKCKEASNSLNESDSEDVEELILKDCNGNLSVENLKGASTPVAELKLEKKELFCLFVYGHNRYTHRRALWESLCIHNQYVRNRPWCLLGDFNAALFLADSTTGSSRRDIAMREFKECVDEIKVMDIPCSGLQFTWNQKPKGFDGLLKKIDRVLGNMQFSDSFVGAHAVFQPYQTSDHSPAVIKIPTIGKCNPKPFKFSNILTQHSRFKEVVNEGWAFDVSGFCMFRLVKKLKNLKKHFRKLLYDQGNIHENVNRLRTELDRVQAYLDVDPFNVVLREEEVAYVQAYNNAIIMQERFLKQKAKLLWLKEGDSNSAYFHKAVKGRVSRSRINIVTDSVGTIYKNDCVAKAFVSHYEVFLGHEGVTSPLNFQGLYDQVLDNEAAIDMIREVNDNEIKEALFSMGNDKSSGPDGYTAAFFKEAWDIVGHDVIKSVKEFFTNGKLLKDLNHTIIDLIPKVQTPSQVNDYRPISCCNVLFKCINKIIANRIKDRGVPRCAFKVDIQKAYDTVD